MTTDASIRRSVTVKAPIALAFEVFTKHFNSWWPRTHHIGKSEPYTAILEPTVGGRWFERGADGSECDWGQVLIYDPPRRVAVSWHLGVNFVHDPDPAKASRVDVTFHAEQAALTRVDLVHSLIDHHGPGWEQVRDSVGSHGGWSAIMELYAKALDGPVSTA